MRKPLSIFIKAHIHTQVNNGLNLQKHRSLLQGLLLSLNES